MRKNQPTVHSAVQPGWTACVDKGLRNVVSTSVQSVLGSALTQELFIEKLLKMPVVESIPDFEVEACSIASCPLLSKLS